MTTIISERTAPDGVTLATRRWPADPARASVVIVHGVAEHAGRYDHVGSALASKGFDTTATDLRGFGRSQGHRAFIDHFDVYLDDLAVDLTEAASGGKPVVLLGHSMGGLIATLYAQSDRPQPDLLVLSTPAIDAKIPRVKLAIAKVLVKIAPKMSLSNGIKGDELSRDPAVGERYFTDEAMQLSTTVKLGIELFEAMGRSRAALSRISLPTLVTHGGDDPIVPPSVSEAFTELPNVERVVFDDFRHESFNEEDGALATRTVIDWIDAQL